ncbi:MAG: restriction endonuclease subunit S [Lentisphaeria bacterium]|nr:restriction endonuclease subunit S [Lentisphaeria bacterium]
MTPQELKNSILQLAIQGRLVEQRPEEGTAEELYKRIQAEKQSLIKAGKLKKEKPLPPITDDEKPFEIPESWMWVYIGDIFLHNTGKAQNASGSSNGTIRKFITTSNLYWNYFDFSKVKEMPFTEQELERCSVRKGDLLVCEGGDCGRSAIWNFNEEVCIQNHVHRLRPYYNFSIEYFYYLFYLYKFTNRLKGHGVAIQGLSSDAIHKVICPLPPLAEQKRIVAKIEELLPLIDRYEKAWSRLEDFNKRFPDDMQKSILQMAIQGKLVEQRPEEGTAEDLYKQIQSEKQSLIKVGKIKKEKPLPPITDDETPFEIPENWKITQFGNVISLLSGVDFSPEEYNDKNLGIPYITGASSLSDNGVLLNRWTETPRVIAEKGDVLLVCKGSGYGKTVICDIAKAHIARQIMAVKYTNLLDMNYVRYYLMANIQLIKSKGQGVIPGIDRGSVMNMIFPSHRLPNRNASSRRLKNSCRCVNG